jgi:hypothetical protein
MTSLVERVRPPALGKARDNAHAFHTITEGLTCLMN